MTYRDHTKKTLIQPQGSKSTMAKIHKFLLATIFHGKVDKFKSLWGGIEGDLHGTFEGGGGFGHLYLTLTS